MIEFTASGTPRVLSRAIEEHAVADGHLTAIVVPWESQGGRVSMAVTSVKSDGWAIEHTNLGTITLTDRGADTTMVAITSDDRDPLERERQGALFDRFAHQIHDRFAVGP